MEKLVIAKIGKGNNFVITCDIATVFAITQRLIALYQCIKFNLIPFNTSRDILRATLSLQKLEREITVIICDRVMVLALYTCFDDLLSMYQVLFNSLLYFQSYASDNLNAAKKKGK